jgi:hypothetical protein
MDLPADDMPAGDNGRTVALACFRAMFWRYGLGFNCFSAAGNERASSRLRPVLLSGIERAAADDAMWCGSASRLESPRRGG